MYDTILESIKKRINESSLDLYAYYDLKKSQDKTFVAIVDTDVTAGTLSFNIYDYDNFYSYATYDTLTITSDDNIVGYTLTYIDTGETVSITAYDSDTGLITIGSGFSDDILADSSQLSISMANSLQIVPLYSIGEAGGNQLYNELRRYNFKLYTTEDADRIEIMYYQTELSELFKKDDIFNLVENTGTDESPVWVDTNILLYVSESIDWDSEVELKDTSQIVEGTLLIKNIKNRC